jgi:hypothetical protein
MMARLSKQKQLQGLLRLYREETKEEAVDLHKVSEWAEARGWTMPRPADPRKLLAQQLAEAAREETRYDSQTSRPYRANHALQVTQGGQQLYLWVDIDHATRGQMLKSVVQRREQIISDVVQLQFDAEHWNNIHPDEQALRVPTDFTDDVEWRINGEDAATG